MRFKDKTVFVTGAASGIGEVTARMFATEGARVVLADLLEEEGVAVTQAINETAGTRLLSSSMCRARRTGGTR
ncbi:hypothetical protein BKK79_36170 (plasmid) [Cupriavidus sp. USMAA2-4]|nr:hypothetical protein BKK79_36170 [Cupriavidus sp. USMAA2-4]